MIKSASLDSFGREQLRELGMVDAVLLGAGMEAVAFRTLGGEVVKLWRRKSVADVKLLMTYYDGLMNKLPFQCPGIRHVENLNGVTVSWERELVGTTLQDRLSLGMSIDAGIEVVITVLQGLKSVAPTPSFAALPVLDEPVGFYAEQTSWGSALGALVERRLSSSYEVLQVALPGLDAIAATALDRLTETEASAESVIHGDLFPGNILLDDEDAPVAVLDFGFLSSVGDPDFDAAVSSGLFDMYSPAALSTTRRFQAAAEQRLNLEPAKATLYLAAYGFITSTAYDANGADGHFAWCVDRIAEYAASMGL